MRAMMSRPVELKSKGEFLCLAGILEDASGPHARMAVAEARRILAETEPNGVAVARVLLSSAASCRYLGHETSLLALAEALAAFVGDAQ